MGRRRVGHIGFDAGDDVGADNASAAANAVADADAHAAGAHDAAATPSTHLPCLPGHPPVVSSQSAVHKPPLARQCRRLAGPAIDCMPPLLQCRVSTDTRTSPCWQHEAIRCGSRIIQTFVPDAIALVAAAAQP